MVVDGSLRTDLCSPRNSGGLLSHAESVICRFENWKPIILQCGARSRFLVFEAINMF